MPCEQRKEEVSFLRFGFLLKDSRESLGIRAGIQLVAVSQADWEKGGLMRDWVLSGGEGSLAIGYPQLWMGIVKQRQSSSHSNRELCCFVAAVWPEETILPVNFASDFVLSAWSWIIDSTNFSKSKLIFTLWVLDRFLLLSFYLFI